MRVILGTEDIRQDGQSSARREMQQARWDLSGTARTE
jgi:hypothetical protein